MHKSALGLPLSNLKENQNIKYLELPISIFIWIPIKQRSNSNTLMYETTIILEKNRHL